MSDSLYVCLFSNGHLKVGRSNEPVRRIASHADRVSCLGVRLVEHLIVECEGGICQREAWLIARCVGEADERFQNEWFTGLDFLTVCGWAREAAEVEAASDTSTGGFGARLRQVRVKAGLTQAELGNEFGVSKAAVSKWEAGEHDPGVDAIRRLCERFGVSADFLFFGFDLPKVEPAPVDFRALLANLKARGMAQTEIAAYCGCDQTTISALNNGRAQEPLYGLGSKLLALHASESKTNSRRPVQCAPSTRSGLTT